MDVRNVLDQLEEALTCTLCSNVIRNPKITPCLHTFCCECLNHLARSRPYQTSIACPSCDYEIQKPEGSLFDSFPSNFYVNRLIDLFLAKKRPYADVECGSCLKNVAVAAFCFVCDRFMCDECLNAHKVVTKGASHRVVAVGNFKVRDYDDLLHRPVFCAHKFKERGVVEYYCYDCDANVCHICNIAIQHKHRIVALPDAASEQKLKLRDASHQMRDKVRIIDEGIHNVEHRTVEVQEQIEYLREDIKSKMDDLVNIIRRHEKEMLQTLETIRKDKHENLMYQLQLYETLLTQTRASVNYVEELLQRNISEEICSMKTYVLKRAQEVTGLNIGTTPAENDNVGYIPNLDLFDGLKSSSLGRVVTSLTEAASSTADGEGIKNVSAGEEVTFVVTTRNAQGEINFSEIDHVVSDIKSAMWGNVESKVINNKDGTYEVYYTPRVQGEYRIMVEVGGKPIKDCPCFVDVKSPVFTPIKSFGSLGKANSKFTQPHGIAGATNGNIAVSDSLKHRIHVFERDGTHILDFGLNGSADGQLFHPMAIAFDKSETNLVVADSDNNRIQIFDVKTGKFIKKFGSEGVGDGQFNGPCGMSVDGENRIIVTDWNNHRIQVFKSDGTFLFKFGDKGEGKLLHPRFAIYHDNAEVFVVSDTGNDVIKVFDKHGSFVKTIGKSGDKRGELCGPRGLAVDKNNNIIVCDFENHRLQIFRLDGVVINAFGTNGKGIGQFAFPLSVSVSADNKVLVSDWGNNRVQIFKFRDTNLSH